MSMPTMCLSQQIRKGYRVFPESDGRADAPGVVTGMSRDGLTVTVTLDDGRTLHYGYNHCVFAAAQG